MQRCTGQFDFPNCPQNSIEDDCGGKNHIESENQVMTILWIDIELGLMKSQESVIYQKEERVSVKERSDQIDG